MAKKKIENINELVDTSKIRKLIKNTFPKVEDFCEVLDLDNRQSVYDRLANKTQFSADDIFKTADTFGLKADDLRKADA